MFDFVQAAKTELKRGNESIAKNLAFDSLDKDEWLLLSCSLGIEITDDLSKWYDEIFRANDAE